MIEYDDGATPLDYDELKGLFQTEMAGMRDLWQI